MTTPTLLSRRRLLGQMAAVPTGLILTKNALQAQQPAALSPLNRFPRMVQEFYVQRTAELRQRAIQRLQAVGSQADAENYVRQAREKIKKSFGPFPERTPLKPQITGVVDRAAYRIEKLIFESRPDFFVTANLYVPKRPGTNRFPAVIGTCGHSLTGKAEPAYQSFAQGLALQGYVVLLYDPIGQGERLQYVNDQLRSTVGVGVKEHLLAGNQQFLVGEFLGSWRAWDGIRALDYLLQREDVDRRHIGVTGNSGGGTMTTWLCGLETRWTMAAPSCFVTTFLRNLRNELPADTEQCPPRALALGLDHFDFLAAMAPKPVIILAKEKDYFDARGAEQAYAQLKTLYRKMNAEENVRLFIGPTYHGYSQENREAMYQWFNRATRVSSLRKEPRLRIEDAATLQCTAKGQVATMASRTVYSFTRQASQSLSRNRKELAGEELQSAVRDVLKLPQRDIVVETRTPEYRILRPRRSRQYPLPYAATYAVETESGLHAVVSRLQEKRHYSRPQRPSSPKATLYIAHHSADAELRSETWLRKMISEDRKVPFYACDVRGIGESRPNTCGENSFSQAYGCDYFYAIHGIMLDYPYVGQKTYDVLRVLDWMAGLGHRQVHVVAMGWGTVPATLAAVLHSAASTVSLKRPLDSFAKIAESQTYDWPLSSFVPGILKQFDLPDCYRLLVRSKGLTRLA